jgi:hypothetical protein
LRVDVFVIPAKAGTQPECVQLVARLRGHDLFVYLLSFLYPHCLNDSPDNQNSTESREPLGAVEASQSKLTAEAADDEHDSDDNVPHGDLGFQKQEAVCGLLLDLTVY